MLLLDVTHQLLSATRAVEHLPMAADIPPDALLAAKQALSKLAQNGGWREFYELQAFHKLPPTIALLAETICLLLGKKPERDFNMPFQRLLNGAPNAHQQFVDLDPAAVPAAAHARLLALLHEPLLNDDQLRRQASPAHLLLWAWAKEVIVRVPAVPPAAT